MGFAGAQPTKLKRQVMPMVEAVIICFGLRVHCTHKSKTCMAAGLGQAQTGTQVTAIKPKQIGKDEPKHYIFPLVLPLTFCVCRVLRRTGTDGACMMCHARARTKHTHTDALCELRSFRLVTLNSPDNANGGQSLDDAYRPNYFTISE
eukprot:1639775-Amphidinium_carterae.1